MTASKQVPLRARLEGGGTPLMKGWYLKSETGPREQVTPMGCAIKWETE